MSYDITNEVPLPKTGAAARSELYPFAKMRVGDSFLVPDGDKRKNSVSSAAARFADQAGEEWRFITRTRRQEIDGEAGMRIWRVDPREYPRQKRPRKSPVEAIEAGKAMHEEQHQDPAGEADDAVGF